MHGEFLRGKMLIVQCEHCQTKYRIPDEKVKGKGVKVRCAKCNNTFTVLPASEAPASAASPPQQATPAPEAPPEEQSPEQPPKSPLAESSPEADSDASHPLLPDPTSAAFGDESTRTTEETDEPPQSSLESYEPPSAPEDAGAGGSHRPAHEIDRGAHDALANDEIPSPDLGGFELETTSREDPSQSMETSAAPLGRDLSGTLPSADGEMGWGNISLDSKPDEQLGEDGIGLAGESGFQPAPPQPPVREEGLPGTSPPEQIQAPPPDQTPVPAYQPEVSKAGKGRKFFVALLILALLGTGGYFVYPNVMELIGSQGAKPEGTLNPDNIQVKPLNRQDGKLVYTVRGNVRNNSSVSVGMIQVEAQFRNASEEIVATSSAYCGNVFDDTEVSTGDLGKIRSDLQNELGQSLSNRGIQPGQAVPFLIILENPPSGVSKVTVTISGYEPTT